jgi:Domain of unknown function (DUF4123)
MLHSLIEKGWGKNWGIFIRTEQHFVELRKHLRHLLMVDLPDGKKVYFRFYDPRVMRTVVVGFDFAEAEQFFGPIDYIFCEAGDSSEMLRLQVGTIGVETSLLRVAP